MLEVAPLVWSHVVQADGAWFIPLEGLVMDATNTHTIILMTTVVGAWLSLSGIFATLVELHHDDKLSNLVNSNRCVLYCVCMEFVLLTLICV